MKTLTGTLLFLLAWPGNHYFRSLQRVAYAAFADEADPPRKAIAPAGP